MTCNVAEKETTTSKSALNLSEIKSDDNIDKGTTVPNSMVNDDSEPDVRDEQTADRPDTSFSHSTDAKLDNDVDSSFNLSDVSYNIPQPPEEP